MIRSWLGDANDPWLWMRLTGVGPVVALFALFTIGIPLAGVTGLMGLPMIFVAAIPLSWILHSFSRCPQCERRFFISAFFQNTWSSVCLHCGKKIYTPVDAVPDAAGRDFLHKLRELTERAEHGDWSEQMTSELMDLKRDGALLEMKPAPPELVLEFIADQKRSQAARMAQVGPVREWMDSVRVVEGVLAPRKARDASATEFLTTFREVLQHCERSGATAYAQKLAKEIRTAQRNGALAKITPEMPTSASYFLGNLERKAMSSPFIVNSVREWLEGAHVRLK